MEDSVDASYFIVIMLMALRRGRLVFLRLLIGFYGGDLSGQFTLLRALKLVVGSLIGIVVLMDLLVIFVHGLSSIFIGNRGLYHHTAISTLVLISGIFMAIQTLFVIYEVLRWMPQLLFGNLYPPHKF